MADQDFYNLAARVNQLDGDNLPNSTTSTVAQLQAKINGLQTTMVFASPRPPALSFLTVLQQL